jgi:molybdopterin synthase catalytic subunit
MAGPSFDSWLEEIKRLPESAGIGMYLMHNGVVRGHARSGSPVTGMDLTYDREALERATKAAETSPGILAVRAWINEGHLEVGDDIMRALVAGDIREHVFETLQELVRALKTQCVKEREIA